VKPRFQADADLNQTIVLATLRREPAIDFRTATAAGLAGLSDREVLTLAATEGRILVTHELKTMPRHFAEHLRNGSSPGVLLVPQHLSIPIAVEEILLIWSVTEAREWTDRLVCLPL